MSSTALSHLPGESRAVCTEPSAPAGVSEQSDAPDSTTVEATSPELAQAVQFRNETLANLKKELATAPTVALDSPAEACAALADRLRTLLAEADRRNAAAPVDKLDAALDAVRALVARLAAEAPFAARSAAFDSFSQEVGIATAAIFRAQGKVMDQIKAIKKSLK